MFGILGGASLFRGYREPSKKRPPISPPAPTVKFPSSPRISTSTGAVQGRPIDNLQRWIGQIRRPADITLDVLYSLNVSIKQVSDVSDLVDDRRGKCLIPPRSWLDDGPDASSMRTGKTSARPRFSNSVRRASGQREFSMYLDELRIPNEAAFEVLCGRTGLTGQQIALFSRFWTALHSMAPYKDTFLDRRSLPPSLVSEVKPASKPTAKHSSLKGWVASTSTTESHLQRPKHSRARSTSVLEVKPLRATKPCQYSDLYASRTTDDCRLKTGRVMPEEFRSDAVCGLVEPVAWLFGLSMQTPKNVPLLEIGSMRVPVRLSYSAWRAPSQQPKAREGFLEGPIFGISCRNETGFEPGSVDCDVDIVAEFAALLLLAQERAREGKTERIPGKGKWYTTTPRWGGGRGCEMGRAATIENPIIKKLNYGAFELQCLSIIGLSGGLTSKRYNEMSTVHESALDAWEDLRPGSGHWDSKALYSRVGTDANSEFDEVFLLSSLNHHISIVKMRISSVMLEAITSGTVSVSTATGLKAGITVSRTRWYDLFSAKDRMKAMRAVWAVSSYMTRAV